MNTRIRSVLIIIGILTLIVIGIIVIPRTVSLYYQTKGGQHIEYVLRATEGIQELVCEQIPINNEDGRNEVEQAIVDLNRAISFNKNNTQTYYYLGKAHCLLGEPADAKENYIQYIELRPNNPLGYIGLVFVYERLDNNDSALDTWKKGGISVENFLDVGGQKLQAEEYGDALQWYQRALSINPSIGSPWYYIGLIREEFGDLVSAESAYLESTTLSPEFVNPYYALGDLYSLKLDDYGRAIQFYESATEIDDLPIKAYLGIGNSAEELNEDEQALLAYLKAGELSDQVLGDAYDQVWLRVWPKYVLGDFYLRKGELEKSKQFFNEALEGDKYQYFSVYSLWGGGRTAYLSDDLNTALEMLTQALEFNSNYYIHSQINLAFGRVYIKQGDLETGLEYVRNAHSEHQDNQGLHRFLAELLTSAGYSEEAISEYEEILMKWPSDLTAKRALEEILDNQ